ncbi:MAG: CotH kinase family protein, partial [Eubacteriales bacterium]
MSMHTRKLSRHPGRRTAFLWLTAMFLVITLALACLLTACRGETGTPDDSREQSEYTDTTTADTPGSKETSASEGTPGESPVTDDREPTESTPTGEPTGTDAPDTAGEPTETNQPDTSEEATDPEVLTLPPVQPPTTETAEETAPFDPSSVAKETMPRLDIVTEGGQSVTSKEVYVRCTVSMSDCDESFAFTDSPAGIRVRGNSTAGAPKKPYRLKFDVKQPMLDLNDGHAFRNWCLMADYFDSSMLRTYATFQMAEALLDGCVYSSDCAHVEVYLNGVYQGVYLLCEQTQINKNRINIYEKEDEDTSLEVGYLMIGQGGRFDEPGNIKIYPNITVTDRNGQSMHYGEMNFALQGSEYTEEQKAYCSTYVSAVFQ